MDKNLDIKICCDEMRTNLYRQIDGIGNIKSTTRTIFQSASLVIALIGALQIFSGNVSAEYLVVFRWGIGIVFFLYFVLIFLSMSALFPSTSFGPIKPDWTVLSGYFIGKEERVIYEMQLSAYLNAINENVKVVDLVKKKTIAAGIILGVIILILLLISLIPKI